MVDMKQSVAVVGAGIAGLASAFRLVQAGFKVGLWSDPDEPGATVIAQGVVARKGLSQERDPWFTIKMRGCLNTPLWLDEIEKASGHPITRHFSGLIEPFLSREDFAKLSDRIYHGENPQKFGTKIFEKKDVPRNLGAEWLNDSVAGTFCYPEDGWFCVSDVIAAIKKFLQKQGTEFINARAKRLSDITADKIILALGPGTQKFLQDSGQRLPLKNQMGHNISYQLKEQMPAAIKREKLSFVGERGSYILGSLSEDKTPNEVRQQLTAKMQSFLKLPAQAGDVRSALRVRSADRRPLCGWLPGYEQSIFLLTALHKNGLQTADIFAKQVVRSMRGEDVDPMLEAFLPERFVKNSERS